MKLNKTLTALAIGASFGLSGQAFAGGTAANTPVTNTVTLNYKAGTTVQDSVSSVANFLVDEKVNFKLVLQDNAALSVTPNGINYVSTYILSNEGNSVLDYSFATQELSDGSYTFGDPNASSPISLVDNTTVGNISVRVENDSPIPLSSNFSNTFDETADTDTSINDLGIDEKQIVYVYLSSVSGTAKDADLAVVELKATAKSAAGTTLVSANNDAFNPSQKQTVFADLGNDGVEAINTAFIVESAGFFPDPTDPTDENPKLSVTIIDDSLCTFPLVETSTTDKTDGNSCAIAGYKPKAIPNAIAKFTITAVNRGSKAASEVRFEQSIASLTGIKANSLQVTNILTTPVMTLADSNTSTDEKLDIEFATVAAGATVTITFTAIVE